MPEKAPGSSGSLQGWRLPTDSFSVCTDQAARGLGAWEPGSFPHQDSLQAAHCRRAASLPPRAQERGAPRPGPPLSSSLVPFPEQGQDPQTQARWQPSRPNKGTVPSNCGNSTSYLFRSESGKSVEKQVLFLPRVEGGGEADSVGRRLGGKKLTDIFRDMGIRQAGTFRGQKHVLFQSQF